MPAGKYRSFNGKRFERMTARFSSGLTKQGAKKRQMRLKKQGCKTRIVQDMVGWYYVYARCSRR